MWMYRGKEFDENLIASNGLMGFVYLITNTQTGKIYVGKKLFTKAGYRTVKKKRKKLRKESNWKEYFGSNNDLNEDVKKLGKEHFTREILHLCKTKGECSYLEAKEQFLRKCLEIDNCYNYQIRVRVVKSHLKKRRPLDKSISSM